MNKSTAVKIRTLGRGGVFVLALLLINYGLGMGLADDLSLSKIEGKQPLSKNYKFSVDWFTHNVPQWQRTLGPLKGKPKINYLEIGVCEGRSLIWVLENILTHPTAKATCVDIFSKTGYL